MVLDALGVEFNNAGRLLTLILYIQYFSNEEVNHN